MSIIFRNVNGNPHTPIDTQTGDVAFRNTDINSMSADELKEKLQRELPDENLFVKKNNGAEQKEKVLDYVKRFREGKQVEHELVLSDVGDKERKAIEELTGEPLTATKHVLALDELRHIEKGHGIDGESDHSMADTSKYEQIIEVLHNPDNVVFCVDKKGNRVYSLKYRDKANNPAKVITFIKAFEGYKQMVVEAVCNSKYGKLHIISSYTKKESRHGSLD